MPRGVYDRSKKTKKKLNGAAPKAPRVKGKEPNVLQLTESELLRMEKLSTQIRACDGDQMITLSQKNAYIAKIDPQGVLARFDQRLTALRQERQEAEVEYKGVTDAVEKRLSIKLAEYAYDDKTGILRKIGEDVAPPPLSESAPAQS